MLDGALFKQETAEDIMTLHVLWVQKNTSNEGLVFAAREFFVNGFWQLDPKPPTVCQVGQYQ